METITGRFAQSIEVKRRFMEDPARMEAVSSFALKMAETLGGGGCVFFAGNGGSAADCQHLAAELVSRFYYSRRGLAAEALTVNTSILTAIANDYSFDRVFARQLEARGRPGDMLVAISTSGSSKNVLAAAEAARGIGMSVVAMTGEGGGPLAGMADISVMAPATDTPRIQELHILVGHIVCEIAERVVCPKAGS